MVRLTRGLLAPLLCVLLLPALSQAQEHESSLAQARQALIQQLLQRLGQPVSLQLDIANHEDHWYLFSGEVLTAAGETLDWSRIDGCEPQLDALLWAVMQWQPGGWRFEQLEVCSPEPVYWYLGEEPLSWPCGVYHGLQISADDDLEQRCRQQRQ